MIFLRLALIYLLSILVNCATKYDVVDDYQGQLVRENSRSLSKETTVFFLIDGLQLGILESELRAGRIPNIQNYFLSDGRKIHQAHTTFPSLTYPAIASLLTETSVSNHGILGNQILRDGRAYNFENVKDHDELNRLLDGRLVFTRLKSKGFKTVSLDFAFRSGALAHTNAKDLKAGVSILAVDYNYIDTKTIESLLSLLKTTPHEQWPEFIFVHLIGLDFVTHDHGPQSPRVYDQLYSLDRKLGPVLNELTQIELTQKRKILGLLTSDHGFDTETRKVIDLEKRLRATHPELKILNEGRVMSLFFPDSWSWQKRRDLLNGISLNQGIAAVAYPTKAAVNVLAEKTILPPHFTDNLADYFKSPFAPGAVIVAESGSSFHSLYKGLHGGPTESETIVPLLLKGVKLKDQKSIPAMWELLRFL